MSELDVTTIDRTDCLKYLDEYVRNLEQNPDDYDMMAAAKALRVYVRKHALELSRLTRAIGWLPLEYVEPETIDEILEEAKWEKGK